MKNNNNNMTARHHICFIHNFSTITINIDRMGKRQRESIFDCSSSVVVKLLRFVVKYVFLTFFPLIKRFIDVQTIQAALNQKRFRIAWEPISMKNRKICHRINGFMTEKISFLGHEHEQELISDRGYMNFSQANFSAIRRDYMEKLSIFFVVGFLNTTQKLCDSTIDFNALPQFHEFHVRSY